MNELHATVKNIEDTLQDARGELSVFEYKFPTDSPEQQLIVELLERLDEASDPEVIEENVRDYSDDYGVDSERVIVQDLQEGDIILSFGEPFEVTALDGWWNEAKDLYEREITGCPWQGEEETVVIEHGRPITIALRD